MSAWFLDSELSTCFTVDPYFPLCAWFLGIVLSANVGMCVSAPEGINNKSHERHPY